MLYWVFFLSIINKLNYLKYFNNILISIKNTQSYFTKIKEKLLEPKTIFYPNQEVSSCITKTLINTQINMFSSNIIYIQSSSRSYFVFDSV